MSGKDEFEYVGGELTIFAHAKNWKAYWSSALRKYLGPSVLEVGAGLGANTSLFGQEPFQSWLCLEPDKALLAQARENVKALRRQDRYEFFAGTLAELNQAAQYDTIVYIDVLEHIEKDGEELQRAARHLKSNGYLLVLSPAHSWLFSKFDSAIGHYRRYSRGSLRALTPQGLQVEKIVYLDSCGLFASLANKLFLRQSLPTLDQIKFWDRAIVPVSKLLDPLFLRRIGKTVLGVWKKS